MIKTMAKYYQRDGEIAFRMWVFYSSLAILERMPNLGKVTILLSKVSAFANSDLFRTQATAEEKDDLEEVRRALLAIHEPESEEEQEVTDIVRRALKAIRNPVVDNFSTGRSLKLAHFANDLEMSQDDFEAFRYEFMWLARKEFLEIEFSIDSTVGEFIEHFKTH